LEVFEEAEEDGDEGVAVDVLNSSLLEEDVCFVKKEDCTPGVGDVEDLLEFCLEGSGVGAELASADHVQWAFEEF
jgi:hypothetical protein